MGPSPGGDPVIYAIRARTPRRTSSAASSGSLPRELYHPLPEPTKAAARLADFTINLVVVPVGADGKVDFYTSAGSAQIVADVSGWMSTP